MRHEPNLFNREHAVSRTRNLLERLHSPRLAMAVVAALTASIGFVASYILLHVGMPQMWLRYPLAVVIAYLAFLFFLWCWLKSRDDASDLSGDIHDASIDSSLDAMSRSDTSGAADSSDAGLGIADAGDEGALFVGLVVVAGIALFAALFVAFSIISAAPVLLAELLVDAALANGLYRRVRSIDAGRHWLKTAFVRTVWRFAAVAAVAAITGGVIQWLVPGADSIGDILR